MKAFKVSMESVSNVETNIRDAKELKDTIWHKCCETPHDHSGLDYGQTITLSVCEGVEVVHALDLLIDRLLSIKIK